LVIELLLIDQSALDMWPLTSLEDMALGTRFTNGKAKVSQKIDNMMITILSYQPSSRLK